MARRPRIHVPGGFYHVTLRGNHQLPIFFEARDPPLLNDIVARALLKYEARLHAYCWMTNHIHLLVQSGESPLGCFMRQVASEFARRQQWHLPTSGHFFERRYHATLIDHDAYLMAVVRYIHLNPVEAGICTDPADHEWSSHHEYLGARHGSWVTTDFVLRAFDETRTRAIEAYRTFMNVREIPDWAAKLEFGAEAAELLGDGQFEKRVRVARLKGAGPMLDELIAEACRVFRLAEWRLISPMRDPVVAKARCWICAQAIERRIATLSEVARRLNRTEATLRQALCEAEEKERAGRKS